MFKVLCHLLSCLIFAVPPAEVITMLQIEKRMLREVKALVKFILQGVTSQASEPQLLMPLAPHLPTPPPPPSPPVSALLTASDGLPSIRNCQIK